MKISDMTSMEELEKAWLDMEYAIVMTDASGAPFVALKRDTADEVFRILTKLKGEGEARDD